MAHYLKWQKGDTSKFPAFTSFKMTNLSWKFGPISTVHETHFGWFPSFAGLPRFLDTMVFEKIPLIFIYIYIYIFMPFYAPHLPFGNMWHSYGNISILGDGMRHGFHRKSQVKHYQRVVSPMYPWIFVQKNPLLSHIYSYRYSMNIWRCPKSWGDPKNAGWFVSWRIHLEVDDDLGVPPF